LMAAIATAKQLKKTGKQANVTILERCDKVARKLLATGNGRCNLTNMNMGIEFFHGNNLEIVEKILSKFTLTDTLEFFENIGLMIKKEADGKVYPYSLQASAVLDVLRNAALDLGVVEKCSFEVVSLSELRKGFMIKSKSGETVNADIVIMAAGGCASPKLGSNGTGHRLIESVGHRTSEVFPAITQVKTEPEIVKSLQGIKVDGILSLKIGNKQVHEESGEVLFTEYGISGPVAFNIARKVGEEVKSKGGRADITVSIDLIPEMSGDEILNMLIKRAERYKGKIAEHFVLGLINKRVGQAVLKISDIKLADNVADLKIEQLAKLAKNFKGMKLKCIGTQSFQNAQVTAGGALLEEFSGETLESLKNPELFACGEILDVDGDCGGYNLQWAWSSGYVAGHEAAEKI